MIAAAFYEHYDDILNFYNNRSSNASAESFNAKIKLFRANLRGGLTRSSFFLESLSYMAISIDYLLSPQYIAKGGKLGRKVGSTKTKEQKKEEYKEVIALLKKGYSIRNIQLRNIGISTAQRSKKDFDIL